jgi:multidrug efflux pump subunit AcrA (membrane-fusion protein)
MAGEAAARVREAESARRLAEARLARAEALHAAGSISAAELGNARAAAEQATSAVDALTASQPGRPGLSRRPGCVRPVLGSRRTPLCTTLRHKPVRRQRGPALYL